MIRNAPLRTGPQLLERARPQRIRSNRSAVGTSGPVASQERSVAGERGTAAAELAVAAPLLLLLVVAAVFVGRLARAEGQVEGAVRDAARAAAARRTPVAATAAAQAEASASLQAAGLTCQRFDVVVDTSAFDAGGSVAVRLTCQVSLVNL